MGWHIVIISDELQMLTYVRAIFFLSWDCGAGTQLHGAEVQASSSLPHWMNLFSEGVKGDSPRGSH